MSNQSKTAHLVNDAYFTPEDSVKWCHSFLYVHDWVGYNKTILEPCVGSGNLVEDLPGIIFGADIKDYGWKGTIIQDYLTADKQRVDLVFTNPPFGRVSSLAVKFFNKATKDSDRIAFIAPASFRKISIVDRLDPYYHCIVNEMLPNNEFILPNNEKRKVNTVFQMWERRNCKRPNFTEVIRSHSPRFMKVSKDFPNAYAFRTQGASAGKILNGIDYNPASTAFLVGGKDEISKYDWTKLASFTSGIPAIGLKDVALGLLFECSNDYLTKGCLAYANTSSN